MSVTLTRPGSGRTIPNASSCITHQTAVAFGYLLVSYVRTVPLMLECKRGKVDGVDDGVDGVDMLGRRASAFALFSSRRILKYLIT